MKLFNLNLILITFLYSVITFATDVSTKLTISKLEIGDIVLKSYRMSTEQERKFLSQQMNKTKFRTDLIIEEEGTPYAHMGIVIKKDPLLIAEALPGRGVRSSVGKEFLDTYYKHSRWPYYVLRHKEWITVLEKELYEKFQLEKGRPYNDQYLWTKEEIDENLPLKNYYCSQLVTYLLKSVGIKEVFIKKKMNFKHPSWIEYYTKDQITRLQSTPGNSPTDFYQDKDNYEHFILKI